MLEVMDPCRLRYSNQSFFSVMALDPRHIFYNTNTTRGRQHFMELVVTLMKDRAEEAAKDEKMFAHGNYTPPSVKPIYYLLQCMQDLSIKSCNSCLVTLIDQLPNCCSQHEGARILSPSCIVHYESYPITGSQSPTPSLTRGTSQKNKSKQIKVIASVSAAIVGIIMLGSCIYEMWRRKNQNHEENKDSHHIQLLHFRIDVVSKATKNFCNECKLGEGRFGPVYKGVLDDGKEIAVKRLSKNSGQGHKEFMNEVTLIARLQHRNHVRLLGCCLEENEMLLVYEYMPNKSLDVFLFDPRMSAQLDWQTRFSIINGIARGLMYLHEDSRLRIIHRDLKASSILLDSEMNPKISDFGMARIFGEKGNEVNTNRIVGTYGYMAPEYAMEGLCSIKSDVFSFGVLLLEIISGKRNSGFYLSNEGESLLTFAWKLWSEGEGMKLMEASIVKSSAETEVQKCIHIGLLCVQGNPTGRPTMSSVVVMLGSDAIALPQPGKPLFSVGQFVAKSTSSSNPKLCSVNEATVSSVTLVDLYRILVGCTINKKSSFIK